MCETTQPQASIPNPGAGIQTGYTVDGIELKAEVDLVVPISEYFTIQRTQTQIGDRMFDTYDGRIKLLGPRSAPWLPLELDMLHYDGVQLMEALERVAEAGYIHA